MNSFYADSGLSLVSSGSSRTSFTLLAGWKIQDFASRGPAFLCVQGRLSGD